MREIENWEEVKEAGEYIQMPIGPQICKIIKVEDVTEKEYLKIYFDVADGELKGTFKAQEEAFNGDWPNQGITYRSYKKTALSFFKAFIVAVEKSNPDFKWNWDEQTLVGKYVIANFGSEEYINDKQELKVGIKAREFRSLQAFREGSIKLLKDKVLKSSQKDNVVIETKKEEVKKSNPVIDIGEDDLPF